MEEVAAVQITLLLMVTMKLPSMHFQITPITTAE
jgi:hypothetical protein